MNLISKIGPVIDRATRVMNVLGLTALSLIVLITTADVLLRALFNEAILGVVEITEYAMIIVVYFALGWCTSQNAHARVDLMVGRFSPRAQAIIDCFTTSLGIVVVVLISWQGYSEFLDAMKASLTSSILEIPSYPFYLCLGLGSSIFGLALLKSLIGSIVKGVRG